jgi:hypothetical protein
MNHLIDIFAIESILSMSFSTLKTIRLKRAFARERKIGDFPVRFISEISGELERKRPACDERVSAK